MMMNDEVRTNEPEKKKKNKAIQANLQMNFMGLLCMWGEDMQGVRVCVWHVCDMAVP